MRPIRYAPVLLALLLLAPLCAVAENSTTAGGYTIHHNAFITSNLTPEVAKAYGILRSKFRGMLNVSVIKEAEGTTGTPVPAQVAVETVLLTGQQTPLPMREIKEQEAVYYVGEFPVQNNEIVNFRIEVSPEGAGEPFIIKMEEQFFTD